MMQKNYTCPVCGYDQLSDEPFSESKGRPSYEICPSCAFHFGYDDDAQGYTYQQWRNEWIKKGMPWFSSGQNPPEGWNPAEQIKNLEKSIHQSN